MTAIAFVIDRQLWDAEDLDQNKPTASYILSEVGGYSLHAVWTGSPVGDLLVEGSNDGVNFVTITTQALGGAAGQYLLNVERQHYKWGRVSYDFTSGLGSINLYLTAKDI